MQFAHQPAHFSVPHHQAYYWGMPATLPGQPLPAPAHRRLPLAPAHAYPAPFIFGQPTAPPRFWLPPAFAPAWAPTEPYHLSPLSISDTLPDAGFPPSPTDSSASTSPPPQAQPITSAVPLLAPRPLPFHSPRFLQFDDLPDTSEDLSHAPYVRRPKRKHASDEDEESVHRAEVDGPSPAKRPMLALPAARRAPAGRMHGAPPTYYSHRAPHPAYTYARDPLALRC